MRIIGIDPGQTTGIVTIDVGDGDITVVGRQHIGSLQVGNLLWAELTAAPASVAMERFNISQRTLRDTRGGSLEALYTIGVVRYVCANAKAPCVLQEPATAKHALNDDVLRSLGFWDAVAGPHERDALRHALLYARTQKLWKGTPNEAHSHHHA